MRRQIFRWTVFFVGLTSTRQGRGRLPKAKSAEVSPPSRVLEARVILFPTVLIPSARPGPVAMSIAAPSLHVTLSVTVICSTLVIYFVAQGASASIRKVSAHLVDDSGDELVDIDKYSDATGTFLDDFTSIHYMPIAFYS